MHRSLQSVLLLVALVVIAKAAPLSSSKGLLDGPICKSPIDPSEQVDCAVLLQMSDLLLKQYETGMQEYQARLLEARLMTDKAALERVTAKASQIGGGGNSNGGTRTCLEYRRITTPTVRDTCIRWSDEEEG